MLPLKLSLTSVKQNQNVSEESGYTRAALNVRESRNLAFVNLSLFSQNDCCFLFIFFNFKMQTASVHAIYLYFTTTLCILFGISL